MSQTLVAGANTALPNAPISIRILSDRPIDCACYRLDDSGKVRGDGDMIFYGQTQSDDHSIHFRGHDTDGFFDIQLPSQPAAIQKIALAFSSETTISHLGQINLQVSQNNTVLIECHIDTNQRSEKALILAECYRRQGAWKFRFVSQGFDGGLKPLSEYYGVDIADDTTPHPTTNPVKSATAPTATPNANPTPAPSHLNLSKITLTKQQSTINLAKRDDFGQIGINLNWNQRPSTSNQPQPKRGLLSELISSVKQTASTTGIDLDLGAFVALKDGSKQVIQALGGNFGQLERAPYIKLRADDRTGASAQGEWIDINGKYWSSIKEILIYAFIYEGVPNWQQTDGNVTIHVPQQPPIETYLTEGSNHLRTCAIARLVNDDGSIKVERIDRYFNSQKDLDKAFGWGFSWSVGHK